MVGESEGEHEEDEEPSATEAVGSEGSNESGGADGDEELPVSQASHFFHESPMTF